MCTTRFLYAQKVFAQNVYVYILVGTHVQHALYMHKTIMYIYYNCV
jgi:hypothetical protein